MELEFSETELDDILGAFAEFDGMLLEPWDSFELTPPDTTDSVGPVGAVGLLAIETGRAERAEPNDALAQQQTHAGGTAGAGHDMATDAVSHPHDAGELPPLQWPLPVVVTTGGGGRVTWSAPTGWGPAPAGGAAEGRDAQQAGPGQPPGPPAAPPAPPAPPPEPAAPARTASGCDSSGSTGAGCAAAGQVSSSGLGGPSGCAHCPSTLPLTCAGPSSCTATATATATSRTAAPGPAGATRLPLWEGSTAPGGGGAGGGAAAPGPPAAALPGPPVAAHSHFVHAPPGAASAPCRAPGDAPAAVAAPLPLPLAGAGAGAGAGGGHASGLWRPGLLAEPLSGPGPGPGPGAVPDWAALAAAAGAAPPPPPPPAASSLSQWLNGEELLAGLDLAEVFAPPKPSRAKRIRGHVRRAAELRSALAARLATLASLAAQNAALRGRARVLELMLACRDEQLRALGAGLRPGPGRDGGAGSPWSQLAALLPGGAAGGEGEGGGGGGSLADLPASTLLEMFRRLVCALADSLGELQAAAGVWGQERGQERGQGPGGQATAPPAPASPGAGPRCRALAELRARMAAFRGLVRGAGLLTDLACRFADTTLTGEPAPPAPGHWARVLLAAGLSGAQLAEAAALHDCWLGLLGRVRGERAAMTADLGRLLAVNRYGAAYSEAVGTYGTDRDAIHAVAANVMREKVLHVLVGEVLCCHILGELQWAAAIVASQPYLLDPRELMREAAAAYAQAHAHGAAGLLGAAGR